MDNLRIAKVAQKLLDKVILREQTPDLLTVKEASRSYKVSQQEILDLAEEIELNINVGIGCGAGIWTFKTDGEKTLECLNPKQSQERVEILKTYAKLPVQK